MRSIIRCIAMVALASGAFAQSKEALAAAEKQLQAPDPKARQAAVQALKELGELGWPTILKKALRDPEARVADEAQLALGEVADPKSLVLLFGKDGLGSGDRWVRLRVAEALGRLSATPEAKRVIDVLDDRDPEVRRTLAWSLERLERAGRVPDADAMAYAEALDKLVERDKDADVRAAATLARFRMHARAPDEFGDVLRDELVGYALLDKAWQVRAAAGLCAFDLPKEGLVAALTDLSSDEHVGPRALAVCAIAELKPAADGKITAAEVLVERVERETSQRLRLDAYDALVRLSGFKYPLDPKPWKDWLRDPRPYSLKTSDAPLGEYVGVTMTTFAGMRVRSQRVTFLIDLSGSMWEPRGDGKTRKQAVDEELKQALSQLTPETQFNLIPYTLDPIPWQKKLVPATPQNVKSALDFFTACTQRGKGDFWTAFELAFSDPAVDSVIVLTDGAPTGGHRWNLELMKSLLAEKNRFRRVALDAILIDAKGFLTKAWTEMCTANRGTVHSSDL